jgi:hypothetical protein
MQRGWPFGERTSGGSDVLLVRVTGHRLVTHGSHGLYPHPHPHITHTRAHGYGYPLFLGMGSNG